MSSTGEVVSSDYRILLVEDDVEEAAVVFKYLARVHSPKFHVEVINYLQSAVQRLRTERFDAVLLDLQLPDCRGLDSVDDLKALWAGGPIVVLTGMDDESAGIAALHHGAEDYLTKDALSPAVLSRTLRYAIERHRFSSMVDTNQQTEGEVLKSFCKTLRGPISDLLIAASDMCNKLTAQQPDEVEEAERIRAAASQVVALLNNAAARAPAASG